MSDTKTCPHCAETIQAAAKVCRHCGMNLATGKRAGVKDPPIWSPGMAGVMSFFMPGLGQLYKGQVLNGFFWWLLVIVGYLAFVVPGVVLHLLCIHGAMSGDPTKKGG